MKRKKRSISDKERLDYTLRFLNAHPVMSNNGTRVFARATIDAAIRAERASRKEK